MDSTVDYTVPDFEPPPVRALRRRLVGCLPPRRFKASFEPASIARFISPTAMLNDECINSGALLLQYQLAHAADESNSSLGFDARSVALLTTHELVRVQYGVTDDQIWRSVERSEFWSKSVWILPIHRPQHWVLCIIYPERKTLHLFDSLADRRGWNADIKVCTFTLY